MRASTLFFVFWTLELWVYLSGFADPSDSHCGRKWEGPVSLLVGCGCLFLFCRHVYSTRPRVERLLLTIPLILLILILTPLTPVPDSEWSIEVEKSARTLTIYQADVMRGRYSIALGGNPEGDKEFMGDQKTPLGEFRIVDKGPSVFHKWLGLNYPNSEDAYRGRYEGRLTWAEFFYLLIENRNGRIPYGNSALGGAIGIHGGGSGKDWTLGCVALENGDIDKFYDLIPVGTRVRICPCLLYTSPSPRDRQKSRMPSSA